MGAAPRAPLTRIERGELRLPRGRAIVLGQRRANRPAERAAKRRAGRNLRRDRFGGSGGRGRRRRGAGAYALTAGKAEGGQRQDDKKRPPHRELISHRFAL